MGGIMSSRLAFGIIALAMLPTAAMSQQPVNITYGYHPYWTGGWNGVIIKHKELWKKYLPPGSQVKFEPHLTGPPMVNALLAGRMHIGTMGDMPSLVATTKRAQGDIRLVSVPMLSNGMNCTKILVRKDAPKFESHQAAVKWLNDRQFAVHRGTCADRAILSIVGKGGFKPKDIVYMPIEVIASNFEAGRLDAAAMWEPHARRMVELGHARYISTGSPWKETDANFTLMRQDFIEQHPQAAKGWIKAEIEAIQFMINNPEETARIIAKETTGYTPQTAWSALYESLDPLIAGDSTNYIGKMVFDEDVHGVMKTGYSFLHSIKVIESPEVPKDAVNDGPLKQALTEMKLTAPIGRIEGQPRRAVAAQ